MRIIIFNIFIDFLRDTLGWVVGIIALIIVCGVAFILGLLGVQLRSGVMILGYIRRLEKEAKTRGMMMNDEGLLLKKKGQKQLFYSIIIIITLFTVLLCLIVSPYNYISLLACVPIILGYFGVFMVPEGFGSD